MSQSELPQNRRVNVRAIIFKDGRLFCQKFKNSSSLGATSWGTPGGGIDFGESLHQGLMREIIEETGVRPVIGNLLFIQQFMKNEREYLEFFFHVTNANDFSCIDIEKTSHGSIEIAECGFIDPKKHSILPEFLTTIDLEAVIASSRPISFNYEGMDI